MQKASCKYCSIIFDAPTIWYQYCSDRCKDRYLLETKELADLSACYYCGATADSIDHIPSQLDRAKLINLGLAFKYKFIEVSSCRECNSALGARSLFTLSERKRYIKQYLQRKYNRYLVIPDWSDKELNQINYNLRSCVLEGILIRNSIRSRLRW